MVYSWQTRELIPTLKSLITVFEDQEAPCGMFP